MLGFILKFILTAVLVYGLSMVLPGVVLGGVGSAAILVIVLGLLNAVVKPILKILGFPITVLTLGLFLLVINVIIVKLADFMMTSFDVHGFLNALLFSLALSVVNSVVDLAAYQFAQCCFVQRTVRRKRRNDCGSTSLKHVNYPLNRMSRNSKTPRRSVPR